MPGTPIPQRIAPLTWRGPALLWTPIALALAIGWPLALFRDDPAIARLAVIGGAAVYAIALTSLGATWALGRAPRTRREVVMHVIGAGAIASLLIPLLLTQILGTVAEYNQTAAADSFTLEMSLAMTPLALVIGLPTALISGFVFALVALTRPKLDNAENDLPPNVQPFR